MAGMVGATLAGCQQRDDSKAARTGHWERGAAHAEAPAIAPAEPRAAAAPPAAAPPPAATTIGPTPPAAGIGKSPASPKVTGTHAAETGRPAPARPLQHPSRSVDELMTKMLAALEARDLPGLEQLRVTEAEHTELLWPEFPAKDHNVQPNFAWDMLNSRSHIGAGRAIGDYGGQELILVGVEFIRDTERYPSFVLHRGTLVHARTQTGDRIDLPFLGSVLELDGQFKFLSFKE
jgi:hypothetical protein